jgi:hypothetical protein
MIKTYINYSESKITVHRNPLCEHANVGPDQKIRHVLINQGSISKELERFRSGNHRFSDETYMNDMWLIFDFQDSEFELALVRYLQKTAGLSNSTILSSEIQLHC